MVLADRRRSSVGNSEIEASAGVRKIVEMLKEIVGDQNHSNADILSALKDSGMEPNQAAQKLLNQDPFREVRRKRDKKKQKENIAHVGSADSAKLPEKPTEVIKSRVFSEDNSKRVGGRRYSPNTLPDNGGYSQNALSGNGGHSRNALPGNGGFSRNALPGNGGFSRNALPANRGYSRNILPSNGRYSRKALPANGGNLRNALPGAGVSREFRVVKDNRISSKELESNSNHVTTSTVQNVAPNVSRKSSTGTPNNKKSLSGLSSPQGLNGSSDSRPKQAWGADKRATDRKNGRGGKGTADLNAVSQVPAAKPKNSDIPAATITSNSSAVGVYSSSTDPIHVPSPNSRTSPAIRAIKREVGVVGGRRLSTGINKSSSTSSSSPENPPVCSPESFQPFSGIPKTDQVHQSTLKESVVPTMQANRTYQNNQSSSKPHQQSLGRQKASQSNKEWRPKSSHKSSSTGPGIIGSPSKSTTLRSDISSEVGHETAKIQDKLLQTNLFENQNVVIPDHIRVPATDRCRLTFGSFGTKSDSSTTSLSGPQTVRADRTTGESTVSLSARAPESLLPNEPSVRDEPENIQVTNFTSDFTDPDAVHEHKLPEKKEMPSPQNIEHYSEIGIVQENSLSVAPPESHQQQEHPELSNFAAYDPQAQYDIPYFRHTIEESVRGQDLQSSQEPLNLHTTDSIPASTIAMMQQQAPVAQMYPQLHVSHYANVLPYRQFLSPVYVPPMAMPGYSTNPAYPHPSTGSSYVLMPGGSSHLGGTSLKYGMQQFKPVPTGNPTGFGNFVNPTGYAMNATGVVSSGAGLEDSSRIKYKDGNVYIASPQAETSEVWVQNQPRDFPGLQSTPYYNMPGQTPHAAYLQSHNGHASFNAAAAQQSSHMQFPGVYHSPQPTAMSNPHHLGPALGSNVQVGVGPAAPGAPIGAYQQPQLGAPVGAYQQPQLGAPVGAYQQPQQGGPVGAYQQPQQGLGWTANYGGV